MAVKNQEEKVKNSKPVATRQERVQSPKVNAGECPKSPRHTATVVYRTAGRTRYCKCNDCGATWKQSGEYADSLREFCASLADSLQAAPRVRAADDADVVVLDDKTARHIITELRRLVSE